MGGGSKRKEAQGNKPAEIDKVTTSTRSSSAPKYERELSESPATAPFPERLHSQSVVIPVRGSKRTSFHSEGGNPISQSYILLSSDKLISKAQQMTSSSPPMSKSVSSGNLRLEELVSTTSQTDFLKNVKFGDIHHLLDPSKVLSASPPPPTSAFDQRSPEEAGSA